MKRLSKLFTLVLCLAAGLSVTSCVESSDDNTISPETYQAYLTSISGSYFGSSSEWQYENKIYFINDTITDRKNTQKLDSITGIDVRFSVDSTVTVNYVPGRLIAKELPVEYQDLKDAIENAPNQTLKARFMFYQVAQGYASYTIYPETLTYPELEYGGAKHKVDVVFYYPTAGAFAFGSGRSAIRFTLSMAGIYEDDKLKYTIYDGSSGTEKMQKSLLDVYATK